MRDRTTESASGETGRRGGGREASGEQVKTLRWAASLGAITAEALALRTGVSVSSARARLAGAARRGLLARERPLADGASLWAPTAAGMRACGARELPRARVTPANASHTIACALAAAALERCYPGYGVIGERELRRQERASGRLLASARVWGGGCPRVHSPDLVLVPGERERAAGAVAVAVEVELTVKAPRRLLAICRGWARCTTVGGVLYVASPAAERALRRALAGVAEGRIAVVGLSALAGVET